MFCDEGVDGVFQTNTLIFGMTHVVRRRHGRRRYQSISRAMHLSRGNAGNSCLLQLGNAGDPAYSNWAMPVILLA
jgi:hypothetical protein